MKKLFKFSRIKTRSMANLRNSFPFIGFLTHKHPKRFKFGILLQIGIVCLVFGVRIILPGEISENYKLSYYFSNMVLVLTVLSAIISLLESYRTIEKQKLLIRKMDDIDFYLGLIPRSQQWFLRRRMLIVYGSLSIVNTVAFLFIVHFGGFQGNSNFYIFPVSVLKLRIFQITVWLDELAIRMVLFNKKLQSTWHLRAFMNIKKIYLIFLDINTLFHQCFECSLMFMIICFLMDYINSLYWSLLPLLGFLEYKYLVLCIPTVVTIGFQVCMMSRVCQFIDDEVSSTFQKAHIKTFFAELQDY